MEIKGPLSECSDSGCEAWGYVKPVARGGFTMKLIKLKIQGHSPAHVPTKALEGSLAMS
jgi:hypothetical protein